MMQELYTVMSVGIFIKNIFSNKIQNCTFTAWQISWQAAFYFHKLILITSYLLLILHLFYNIPTGLSNTVVLLVHNRDFSEYVILYRSFDESFNYPEQS